MTSVQHLSELARTTHRLNVRLLNATDRAAWIRAHEVSADHFRRWMPSSPAGCTLDAQFEHQLKRTQDGIASGSTYVFVAEMRDEIETTLAAFLSLSQVFRGPFQNAYAGWRVSKPFVGRGIGTEAVRALLDLAFLPPPLGLGLHRVQANVMPGNKASLKLARRVGFREEGYAPRYLEIAGTWEDHVLLAKLADEHHPLDPA